MAAVIDLGDNKYRVQIYIPIHLRKMVLNGGRSRTYQKHMIIPGGREKAQAEADALETKLQAEWGKQYKARGIGERNSSVAHSIGPRSEDFQVKFFNNLVREAYEAQKEFDEFDCDTIKRPGDLLKLRQLTAEWDRANLQLVRYVLRNGESLIRDFGGRVAKKDRNE